METIARFGTLVRSRRTGAGLTLEALANRTRLSTRTIANIEAGRVRRPHPHSVHRLADALGLHGPDRSRFVDAGHAEPPQAPPGSAVPARQLPAAVPEPAGRAAEVERLTTRLINDPGGGAPVVVVTGGAGLGKTTLALHVAYRVADRFPGGVCFVELGGWRTPLPAFDVLGRLLRALCGDDRYGAADLQDRAVAYRSLLAARRCLVLLDNARDERQVRPLLPGAGRSAVLVTARRRPDALERTEMVDLGPLPPAGARKLLARLVAPGRLDTDPVAVDAVVTACAGVPLALRIAGARLAARPQLPLAAFAALLADDRFRLDELCSGDLSVRDSIADGCAALGGLDLRALHLTAHADARGMSAADLAPLLAVDHREAAACAERLTDRRLLDVVGADADGTTRYRPPDLVRLYAGPAGPDENRSVAAAVPARLGRHVTPRRTGDPVVLRELQQGRGDPDPDARRPGRR